MNKQLWWYVARGLALLFTGIHVAGLLLDSYHDLLTSPDSKSAQQRRVLSGSSQGTARR